jgi:DNA-directed RNA polymerase subunit RPC12/RpoP
VKEGLTYTFTNVRVRKNNTNASVSVSTPNSSDCTIQECKPFTEPLATPAELPETFTSKTVKAEVIGITKCSKYYTCLKCKTKFNDVTTVVVKCNNCNFTQKLEKARKNHYLHVLIEAEEDTQTITFFEESIKQAMALAGVEQSLLTDDLVTNTFLGLPNLSITYDRKTKIVSEVSLFVED